jgi:hypothetical protein
VYHVVLSKAVIEDWGRVLNMRGGEGGEGVGKMIKWLGVGKTIKWLGHTV